MYVCDVVMLSLCASDCWSGCGNRCARVCVCVAQLLSPTSSHSTPLTTMKLSHCLHLTILLFIFLSRCVSAALVNMRALTGWLSMHSEGGKTERTVFQTGPLHTRTLIYIHSAHEGGTDRIPTPRPARPSRRRTWSEWTRFWAASCWRELEQREEIRRTVFTWFRTWVEQSDVSSPGLDRDSKLPPMLSLSL